jgi:hypothetical protein
MNSKRKTLAKSKGNTVQRNVKTVKELGRFPVLRGGDAKRRAAN